MVAEKLGAWKEVFEHINRMFAADLIDSIMIYYTSSVTGRSADPRFYTITSANELKMLADVLPGTLPLFTEFEIMRGDEQTIGDRVFHPVKVVGL